MNNEYDLSIRFDDKVILITGGTSGIGLESAKMFANLGAKVAICGRSKEKIAKAKEELSEYTEEIIARECDVSNYEDLRKFADFVLDKYNKIDVWIANAGIYPQYKIIDTPIDVWDKTISINQDSVFYSSKIVYDLMKDQGGVFLIASSFASKMPSVGSGAYAATKSAVSSMIKTLSSELAPFDIRVNGYMPGVIFTGMTEELVNKNHDAMKKTISQQKFGEPIDVAWLIAFLASDYCRYITGEIVEISGGKMSTQNPGAAWTN